MRQNFCNWQYKMGVTNTGNGERGTGNGERVHSGNPYKNSKWRTKTQKQSEM